MISGDIIRSLAVFVAATPCPLILAAPVAFIAGVACSARRGILVKGGGPLEALARAHTVLFDKTGSLTVGGARLLSIEPAREKTLTMRSNSPPPSSRPRTTSWLRRSFRRRLSAA